MQMKNVIFLLTIVLVTSVLQAQSNFQKDFDFYWQTVEDNFAYFQKQGTDWNKVKTIYQSSVDTVTNRTGLIHLFERVNNEFYNGHVFLNTNTASSNRTVPTGSDIKMVYRNGAYIIDEVRSGFNADLCGLKIGMQVLKFNDKPLDILVKENLPRSINKYSSVAYDYIATYLLAGTHETKRKITVLLKGREKDFYPDATPNRTEENLTGLLESKVLTQNIGYIRINNSLGDDDLIKDFDHALDGLMNTQGLILDLRETPSGGTTTIARAIMGRFISKELPYQKHIYTSEEKATGIRRSTLELVSPRRLIYTKPMIVIVDYWTGSMAEGMAIGFDGMKRAKVMGTKMAGLLGEITTFETPELKIPFSFPTAQLQTVNGLPREDFEPFKPKAEIMQAAISVLKNKKSAN
jgi:C-terminal processing protease CtpA/Prc